jgi:hypothetical protein
LAQLRKKEEDFINGNSQEKLSTDEELQLINLSKIDLA